MGVKYVDSFNFPPQAGFTGSAVGRHDSMDHPLAEDKNDEYGDGLKKGGRPVHRAMGGGMPMPGGPPSAGMPGGGASPAMPGGSPMGSPMPGPGPAAGALGAGGGGGGAPPPPPTIPTGQAVRAAAGAFKLGAQAGAKGMQAQGGVPASPRAGMPQARGQAGMVRRVPRTAPPAVPQPQMSGAPMKEGGKFIQHAIHHPGRMKNLAEEHGVSTHEEMEHDKHSSDPSLRSAANLGLRMTGGDLSPHKRKDR